MSFCAAAEEVEGQIHKTHVNRGDLHFFATYHSGQSQFLARNPVSLSPQDRFPLFFCGTEINWFLVSAEHRGKHFRKSNWAPSQKECPSAVSSRDMCSVLVSLALESRPDLGTDPDPGDTFKWVDSEMNHHRRLLVNCLIAAPAGDH